MKYTTEEKIYFQYKLFKKMMFFLIHSNDILVRVGIAEQGYRLDILVNDPDWIVREEVAKKLLQIAKEEQDEKLK